MFIGRIITNSRSVDTIDCVDKTSDTSKIDNDTPTLIIGKKIAISIYGQDKIKALNKQITDNVFWTYSKTEKRNVYESDIVKFNKYLIKKISKDVVYKYFNIFTEPYTNIKILLDYVNSYKDKVFYVTDKNIYIYNKKKVYGISFDDLFYVGITKEKALGYIKRNPYNYLIQGDSFLNFHTKKYLENNCIIVPYLYFMLIK